MLKRTLREASKKINRVGLSACWYGVCFGAGDNISTYPGLVATTQQILQGIIGVAGLAAVGILVYGGYMFIMSGGESDKVEKAQNIIKYAVMGLILVFLSVLIVNTIYDVVL